MTQFFETTIQTFVFLNITPHASPGTSLKAPEKTFTRKLKIIQSFRILCWTRVHAFWILVALSRDSHFPSVQIHTFQVCSKRLVLESYISRCLGFKFNLCFIKDTKDWQAYHLWGFGLKPRKFKQRVVVPFVPRIMWGKLVNLTHDKATNARTTAIATATAITTEITKDTTIVTQKFIARHGAYLIDSQYA